jgi:hypothetical protein
MRTLFKLLSLNLLLALALPVLASPGAHGPNGEHLDGPAAGGMPAADGRPRLEAFSEVFELVAHLEDDAVVAMINDYATNAPIDGAEVELESSGVTVAATFDPLSGQYRFAEPKLVQALHVAGAHPMAFSITAGDEFDIVAGKLDVSEHSHAASTTSIWPWVLGAFVILALVLFLTTRRSKARNAGARA